MTDHVSSPFYGVATVGTKGQIVIPADAREDMGIGPGDKVIVIGRREHKGSSMVCLVPVERAERFVQELTSKLQDVQGAIKQVQTGDADAS